MEDEESASRAAEHIHRSELHGVRLSVNFQWTSLRSVSRSTPAAAAQIRRVTASDSPSSTGCQVYLGNLGADITQLQIHQIMSQFGQVVSVRCFNERGFAFVDFAQPSEARAAIDSASQHALKFGDRVAIVKFSREPKVTRSTTSMSSTAPLTAVSASSMPTVSMSSSSAAAGAAPSLQQPQSQTVPSLLSSQHLSVPQQPMLPQGVMLASPEQLMQFMQQYGQMPTQMSPTFIQVHPSQLAALQQLQQQQQHQQKLAVQAKPSLFQSHLSQPSPNLLHQLQMQHSQQSPQFMSLSPMQLSPQSPLPFSHGNPGHLYMPPAAAHPASNLYSVIQPFSSVPTF